MDSSTPPSATAQSPPITGRALGQFKTQELLGRGGMGEVYVALDTTLDRKVALKVLSSQLTGDESYVLRFAREAKAAAKLSHPNIVQIFFIGEEGGTHFFAMEFIEGDSVQDIIDRQGALEAPEAARITLEAAQGLRAAATEGLVHRDIKPANLLRTPEGLTKVADFGLAKPAGADLSLTATGIVVGSPLYMSPEQGQAHDLDFRTDIYSLGATLHHMLAGEAPYRADSAMAVILKHINDPVPGIPAAPEPLTRIVCKMMAKELAQRYSSYDELIGDLEAFLEGAEVSAPRPFDSDRARAVAVPVEGLKLLAGNFARILAFGVDWAVLFAVGVVCAVVLPPVPALGIFVGAIAVLYVGSSSRWGGTPGKLLAGIRVETLDGEAPGIDTLTWRFIFSWGMLFAPWGMVYAINRPEAKALLGLFILVAACGHIFGLARADRRAVHDLIAGTMVVAVPKLGKGAVPVGIAVSGTQTNPGGPRAPDQ